MRINEWRLTKETLYHDFRRSLECLVSRGIGVNFMRIITPAKRLTIESRPDPGAILNIPRLVSRHSIPLSSGIYLSKYGRLDKRRNDIRRRENSHLNWIENISAYK